MHHPELSSFPACRLSSTSQDSYLKSTAAASEDLWVFVRDTQKQRGGGGRDVLPSLLDQTQLEPQQNVTVGPDSSDAMVAPEGRRLLEI